MASAPRSVALMSAWRTGNSPIARAAALLLALLPAAAAGAPQRVMSLNLCADVLALHLLPRERIVSVSFLAASSPLSPVRALAQGLPANDSQIEEIVVARPDLVLVHRYSDPRVLEWLERLGIGALTVDLPTSVEAALAQWRRVGVALDAEARAEALIAKAKQALAGGGPDGLAGPFAAGMRQPSLHGRIHGVSRESVRSDAMPPLAAVYGTNGTTQGRNSLLDDLLRHAGFRNLASELGLEALATLPLERLALAQPQMLVLARDSAREQSLADMSLSHPLLRRLARDTAVVELPGRYWSCGGPELIEALQRLRGAPVGEAP